MTVSDTVPAGTFCEEHGEVHTFNEARCEACVAEERGELYQRPADWDPEVDGTGLWCDDHVGELFPELDEEVNK